MATRGRVKGTQVRGGGKGSEFCRQILLSAWGNSVQAAVSILGRPHPDTAAASLTNSFDMFLKELMGQVRHPGKATAACPSITSNSENRLSSQSVMSNMKITSQTPLALMLDFIPWKYTPPYSCKATRGKTENIMKFTALILPTSL